MKAACGWWEGGDDAGCGQTRADLTVHGWIRREDGGAWAGDERTAAQMDSSRWCRDEAATHGEVVTGMGSTGSGRWCEAAAVAFAPCARRRQSEPAREREGRGNRRNRKEEKKGPL